jgi:hypothetical protein
MMSTARGSEPLTDLQVKRLEELYEKANSGKITDKQRIEMTALELKQEKSKTVTLGDTAVAFLLEQYAWETQRMVSVTKEMEIEAFDRGRQTEPESIDLLSFVDNCLYEKNEERFCNDFLTGIPDILRFWALRDHTDRVRAIRDIKSVRDYPLFLYKIHKGVDAANINQLQGYGDILECGDLGVAFTLPNTPDSIREGYKYRLASKLDVIDVEHRPEWKILERSMNFDSIDKEKRVFKVPVDPFTPSEQAAVYERVKHCREWLNNFHESYLKINK